MKSPLEKPSLTEKDIQRLIDSQYEESINLEFKSAEALDFTDKKKMEIAKDVSAFANSAGGYIIYGIKEKNHKPESLSFIDGSTITKEWLEQVIQTGIQRKIEDLIIKPIRFNRDYKKSVYVVEIPESFSAPHMTSDKRFYKRFNFESVKMEEYEIRNLYNRKEKTKLLINQIYTYKNSTTEETEEGTMIYKTLNFQINNVGKALEKDYKLLIRLVDFPVCTLKWDPLRNDKNINHSFNEKRECTFSFFGVSPIFPGELLTIGKCDIGILNTDLAQACEKGKLDMILQYSNGFDQIEIDFASIFRN